MAVYETVSRHFPKGMFPHPISTGSLWLPALMWLITYPKSLSIRVCCFLKCQGKREGEWHMLYSLVCKTYQHHMLISAVIIRSVNVKVLDTLGV